MGRRAAPDRGPAVGTAIPPGPGHPGGPAPFGLVHGAFHGPWCWDRLGPALEARGHRVLTVDLPADDPGAGAGEYADAAVAAFAEAGPDLVVVGHSLGGLTIPLVATRRPVGRLVYLCAMLPRPGRSHDQVAAAEPDLFGTPPDGPATFTDQRGATCWHPEAAAAQFYADCPPEVAAWAVARLRGQHWTITGEVTPLERQPDVPTTAVIGSADRVLNPAWARRVLPSVLGTTPVELPSGHSPFLSHPELLADTLVALA